MAGRNENQLNDPNQQTRNQNQNIEGRDDLEDRGGNLTGAGETSVNRHDKEDFDLGTSMSGDERGDIDFPNDPAEGPRDDVGNRIRARSRVSPKRLF